MIPLSLRRVAELTGGELTGGADPDAVVSGPVVIDSRSVEPGGLFAALPGERVDGHDYAGAAVASGAVAILAARPVAAPAVLVADVVAALDALAAAVVAALPDLTVIGVTGSAGKTSTKDLLGAVLAEAGPTIAPPGNFNNELGYPLTALRVTADTRYLVLEAGARGIGHIAALCRVVAPRIGVELGVGTAHLGEFGSRENIALAKGELVEALPPADRGGVAVLNADDPLVMGMASRTAADVVTFGRAAGARVRATDVVVSAAGHASFVLTTPAGRAPVTLALHGGHQVTNALAAAAVADRAGLAPGTIAAALGRARPVSRWRMEVGHTGSGVTVVNDAYNASPDSLRAALDTVAVMAAGARCHLVLGEMAELGPQAGRLHREAGAYAARGGLATLIAVGEVAAEAADGAAATAGWAGEALRVADVTQAVAAVTARMRPGDVVLVKGSRVAGLERVARRLLAGDGVAGSCGTGRDDGQGGHR